MREIFERFCVNRWDDRERIIPMRMNSWDGLKIVHSYGIIPDLIYIDACHAYNECRMDIETALTLFPNSFLCGDDYNETTERHSVIKAVDELAIQYNKKVIAYGNIWYYE
jgi:hypothetical protein